MNDSAFDRLTPAQQRHLVVRLVLRVTATVVCLIALYYLLPVDRARSLSVGVALVIGLAVLASILTWQIRAIVRSDYPTLRLIEAIAFIIPLYVLGFAMLYFVMGHALQTNFSEPLTRTDALYFTVTIFATVGFGDITAKTDTARLVVTVQMIGNLVLLGVGLRVLLGAAQRGRERHSDESGD
jgi:hypothetical protein